MVCCRFENSPLFPTAIQPRPNDRMSKTQLKAPHIRPQGAHELKDTTMSSIENAKGTALVTGASSGIGAIYADRAAMT